MHTVPHAEAEMRPKSAVQSMPATGVAHLCVDSFKELATEPKAVPVPGATSSRGSRKTQWEGNPTMSPSLGELFTARGSRAFYGSSYFWPPGCGEDTAGRELRLALGNITRP